jgi:hypothetical protein
MHRPQIDYSHHRKWPSHRPLNATMHPSQPHPSVPLPMPADQGKQPLGRVGRHAPEAQPIDSHPRRTTPTIAGVDPT